MTSELKTRLGGGEHEREWTVFEGAMAHDREQNQATAASLRRPGNMRSQSSFYADPELNLIDNVSDAPTRAASPTRENPTMFAKRDMAAVCEEDVHSVRLIDLPLTSRLS